MMFHTRSIQTSKEMMRVILPLGLTKALEMPKDENMAGYKKWNTNKQLQQILCKTSCWLSVSFIWD